MGNREELRLFMDGLYNSAHQALYDTEEHRNRQRVMEETDDTLEMEFIDFQRQQVEELLVANGAAIEGESALLYRQGMKDCVWLLKELGVLS